MEGQRDIIEVKVLDMVDLGSISSTHIWSPSDSEKSLE